MDKVYFWNEPAADSGVDVISRKSETVRRAKGHPINPLKLNFMWSLHSSIIRWRLPCQASVHSYPPILWHNMGHGRKLILQEECKTRMDHLYFSARTLESVIMRF